MIREITPACFQPQMSEHVYDNKKVQINQPPKDSKISASRRFYGKPRPFSGLLPCPRDSKAPSFSLPIIQRDGLKLDMSSIRPVHYSPSYRPTLQLGRVSTEDGRNSMRRLFGRFSSCSSKRRPSSLTSCVYFRFIRPPRLASQPQKVSTKSSSKVDLPRNLLGYSPSLYFSPSRESRPSSQDSANLVPPGLVPEVCARYSGNSKLRKFFRFR